MVLIQINELVSRIDAMMAMVAKGETLIITKEGIPFAELAPISDRQSHWKKKMEKIKLPNGVTTLSFIQEERNLR